MNTNLGYSKLTLTDSNVLLSGGGHKALSDFVGTLYWDSTNKKIQYKKIGDTNYTDLLTFGSNAFNSTSYLPLSGGTLTGNLSFSNSGTEFRGINYGTMGDNDQWRIGGAATGSNGGYMEIATADDGNEPIYVRQYTGVFSSLTRTLTLLDASGNTSLPGNLSCGSITTSGVSASGTSNRLIFRHLDGLNCAGDYDLYLLYHTGAKTYFGGGTYYIDGSGYFNGSCSSASSASKALNGIFEMTGSTSSLPHVWWHIPNVNWCNLTMDASGDLHLTSTNEKSSSYRTLYAYVPWDYITGKPNIGGGGSYNGGNITGTFSSSNGVPLQFTGVGSGTYNVCQWYCNSDGITIETPRATDSPYATSLPFMVKTRGGQYGTLKTGDAWVDGTLYVKEGLGIESRPSGDGLLVYHPNSYTGVASNQWGLGAISCQGVIRSSNSDLIHYRYGADSYTIWDSYNFSPSSYLAKSGGTMSGAIKFRNDRTGIYNLGAGGSTPSGYTTTNDGGNQIMGLISWDGASDEGGILVGSDCCIIYNSSDSGYLFKCVDKDVGSALGNGFGEANVRFAITDGGEGKFYSNCYAANFYTSSDIRKKTNIINISDSIRQFNWKDSGELSYGFIAQELEKTNPELVNKGEDHWTVNYNAAICLVIARLENRIKELEKQLGV